MPHHLGHSLRICDAGRIAPRPVLIIHTPRDATIALSHARQLQAALPSAELWVAGGAEHARNYNADPAAYLARVTAFFDRWLAK